MAEKRDSTGFLKPHVVCLAGILLLALALRVLALLSLKQTIYYDFLLWDERLYHEWAKKIAEGTFVSSTVYEFAPLPAYLTACLYKVFSANPLYVRLANIALGVCTCYLVYLIGRELQGQKAGLVSSIVACCYKPFIFYSVVPLKTSLSVFLFACIIYLFLSVIKNDSKARACLLGAAGGLMLNVRPNCLAIIAFLPLAFVLNKDNEARFLRRAGIGLSCLVLGLFIAVSPFVARNYRVAGKFALTSSQLGFNLYLGNNLENPSPYYQPVPFATSSPFEQGIQFTIEASKRTQRRLSPEEASAFWTGEVVNNALERPGPFLRKLLQKTLAAVNQFEAGDHYHIGFLSRFAAFFQLPLFGFALVFPMGMAGMAVKGFRSRKYQLLGLIFLAYTLSLIVFFSNTRYRLPLMTILIPFSVIGSCEIFALMRERRFSTARKYVTWFVIFIVIEFIPIRGAGDMTAFYNTHAIILNAQGSEDEAMCYWEKSSQMEGTYSVFADFSLAQKHLKKGNWQTAIRYLKKIPDDSFAAAGKFGVIGDIMMTKTRIREAVSAYEMSLQINSGQRGIRRKLVRIFDREDRLRGLEEREKLRYISSFYRVL